MTMDAKPAANTSVAEHMKTVKAAWDRAPNGAKKDAALKHYQAAEKAVTGKQDAEATRALHAATQALA